MLKLPRGKAAIIPIYDPEETRGGIVKPVSFKGLVGKKYYVIIDTERNKKIDEAEDVDRLNFLLRKYRNKGIECSYKTVKTKEETQPFDSGDRCNQGVVKYLGLPKLDNAGNEILHNISIGDYVFYSGYSGTLMYIEGEGKLIVLPTDFLECIYDIDKHMIVPGLYFKGKDNKYFTATYEQAMNIIAQTFTDLDKTIEVKPSRPKLEDYNVKK